MRRYEDLASELGLRLLTVERPRLKVLAFIPRLVRWRFPYDKVMLEGTLEGTPLAITFTPSGENTHFVTLSGPETPERMVVKHPCPTGFDLTLWPLGMGSPTKTAKEVRSLKISQEGTDRFFGMHGADSPELRRLLGDPRFHDLLIYLLVETGELRLRASGVSFYHATHDAPLIRSHLTDVARVLREIGALVVEHSRS